MIYYSFLRFNHLDQIYYWVVLLPMTCLSILCNVIRLCTQPLRLLIDWQISDSRGDFFYSDLSPSYRWSISSFPPSFSPNSLLFIFFVFNLSLQRIGLDLFELFEKKLKKKKSHISIYSVLSVLLNVSYFSIFKT